MRCLALFRGGASPDPADQDIDQSDRLLPSELFESAIPHRDSPARFDSPRGVRHFLQSIREVSDSHRHANPITFKVGSKTLRDEVTVTSCLRVLLVEDSKVLAERLAETITQNALVELIAQVDTEAAALVVVERESIDVIVLDLHLKRGTGFGVLRGLAKLSIKPYVIVLTNYDLPEYKSAATALGAAHFLDKSRDYGLLPGILHEMCESRGLVPAQ
jgi:two-component system, OmpR family, response regulator